MSPERRIKKFPPPKHPLLSDDEMAQQRGEDPSTVVGKDLPPADQPPLDPNYQPDPHRADEWRSWANEIGKERRPHREDVLPYLLIRATTPGDRGQRPLWPPVVCWESPDILLIDASYTGPFDPSRLVISPSVGRTYRVFVRVWNLGLLPAVGVLVRAWAIAPGFFGNGNEDDPYYQQHHIGAAWIPQLEDRHSSGAMAVVELDPPWTIDSSEAGHHCLIASVTCPADHYAGPLLANTTRHVAQRNLTILAPSQSAKPLIDTFATLIPQGFALEVTHGGAAAKPLLQALAGKRTAFTLGRRQVPIKAAKVGDLHGGIDIGGQSHLLTLMESRGSTVAIPTVELQRTVNRTRFGRAGLRVDPVRGPWAQPTDRLSVLAAPGAIRTALTRVGHDRFTDIGTIVDAPIADALSTTLQKGLGAKSLTSRALVAALGGAVGSQHLLRFTLTDQAGNLVGGYTIVLTS